MLRTIYQDPLWGKSQEKMEPGVTDCFRFENEKGRVIYPFVKRFAGRVDGIDYYDILTPRGDSGPFVDKGNSEEIIPKFRDAFLQYCEDEHIVAEYVKFDPWNGGAEDFAMMYQISEKGFHFSIPVEEDFLYTRFDQNRRRNLRKCMQAGMTLEMDTRWEHLDDFMRLYHCMEEKNQVSGFYRITKEYLLSMRDVLGKDRVLLTFACLDGKRIVGQVWGVGEDTVHYLFGGFDPDYSSICPTTFLLYEGAIQTQKLGKKVFELGGAVCGGTLERYKRSLTRGNGIMTLFIGTAIRNQEIYDRLVAARGEPHIGYFPEYR